MDELLTKEEVAALFKVHPRTIDRWLRSNLLKCYKLGEGKTSLLRFKKSEVEKFLSEHENTYGESS